MSTGTIIGVVVVLVVIVGAAVLLKVALQRRRLRGRFGPEYERAVAGADNRMAAERELSAREREYAKLDIRPLNAATRESYARHWTRVQEQFVDDPATAVGEADRLVTDLMAERGYPTDGGHERQVALLSVAHAKTLGHYREAHDINTRHERGEASTEDLRAAMVHYRTLFEDLLGRGREEAR
ncbi:hypothetical protein GCM10022243_16930 [Saccharothrix violaceirubra]|uniref:Secreted protein n=1 Tax=Saccharothrix violaceirubra TaxID=413306 RepID=A0A7W7T6T0_9PSEU|nr:hypothetical protein [Saccharothrix violaceirubra]MBB4967618.1 hypothetical protein [Saccharothrix violaceirubra]